MQFFICIKTFVCHFIPHAIRDKPHQRTDSSDGWCRFAFESLCSFEGYSFLNLPINLNDFENFDP